MPIRALVLSLLVLACGVTASAAAPSDPIGSAVRVVNRVTGEIESATRALTTGDGVVQNETIDVAADAIGELKLNDDTKLALGPGARLKLDKFVYDGGKSKGAIVLNAVKGAFRFITGRAQKPEYLIRSPKASITVRGTIFDVYVETSGAIWILLHEGALEVCNDAGQCRVLNNPCQIVRVTGAGAVGEPGTWNRQTGTREINFDTAFPFVSQPPQVDPVGRFTRISIEQGTCAGTNEPEPVQRAAAPEPYEPGTASPSRTRQAQSRPSRPASEPVAPSAPPKHAAISNDADTDGASAEPVVAGSVPSGPRWTGFYIGMTAGGAWQTGDTNVGCFDSTGSFDGTTDCSFAISYGALASKYDPNASGFMGGGQLGYNVQTGTAVIGLEADLSWTSLDGSDAKSTDFSPVFTAEDGRVTQDLQWLGTLRGRLGFVTGNWLVYGTGGLAYGRVDYSYTLDFPSIGAYAKDSESKIQVGWTAGAGAEYGIGLWSLKGEYLFYDLGHETLSAQGFLAGGVPTTTYFQPEFETQGHIARIGLNYHLN